MTRTEADLYVETGYRILYEDEFFLAVDKPAPLPVHPVGRFKEKNLLSLLKKHFEPPIEGLRIVNRIDSETSGLVLVAKTSFAAGRLGSLFENREVYKEYRAMVFGTPVSHVGTVSISLGVKSDNGHHVRIPDPEGETAQTRYETLESSGDYSLLKVVPETGRTHQIRAHLAFLGHPIVGDKIYIEPKIFERYIHEGWQEDMRPTVKADRLLLHALKLEFRHPVTGEALKLEAPLPPSFDEFLDGRGEI